MLISNSKWIFNPHSSLSLVSSAVLSRSLVSISTSSFPTSMRSAFFAVVAALAVLSQTASSFPVSPADLATSLSSSPVSPGSFGRASLAQPKVVAKRQQVKTPLWLQSTDPSTMFSRQQLKEKPKKRRKVLGECLNL